ncbi:MAG: acetate--CoA ligase family protein [Alphaproteobacteria bacterium]|nr:MAG: acetate--CoA ligase family protein [Alphaproteobacteria bacterium]
MNGPEAARGPQAVARFLRPRSIAIVGISARAGSAGQVILQSLKLNNFAGDIHLVGRSSEPIDGRPVLKSADELPAGVDLAVFTLPAAAVREAVEACARRKVGSAMIFAAGFAEVGDRTTQDTVTATARAAGLAVVGPNCLGVTNNVDGIWLHMLHVREARRGVEGGVAFVGQSGGLLGHFQRAADGLGLPLSYVISTGNEAGLEGTDFLQFLAEDRATRVIAIYCEEIRRPADFLAACRRARAAGKPIVLMLAGRGAKARKAAQSHTGALVGDWVTIRTQAEHAGAIVVSTMDEMMDLTQILARYPTPPAKGPGILTASGAYVGLTNDFAEEIGLELPELEPDTLKKLSAVLPTFGNYGNPLDVTAGFSLDALSMATKALIDDPNVGMLFISFPISTAIQVRNFNKGMADSPKPKVLVALGDTWQLLPRLGKGAQPEWLGKKMLAAAGVRVPDGDLARTADEAVAVARRIGYPVVLKAQAAALSHKTEAGGVVLNLANESAVRVAWDTLVGNVKRAAPDITLDGVLIEKMSAKGIELMVGAKRDPSWGTVLLVGLGGIWVEALGDVQPLPADADAAQIIEALRKLRSANLLAGFRGAPPADIEAVAQVVMAISRLMQSVPELTEIDVNPLMVQAKGQGVIALDALMVV